MAFFDKLNDIAKNIGDKTGDMVETTKLSAKIGNERTAIAESMRKLGEYYYTQHVAGVALDASVESILSDIDTRNRSIADMQAQIDSIKAGNTPKQADAANTESCAAPSADESEKTAKRFCTQCAAEIPAGAKFCSKCGSPVE